MNIQLTQQSIARQLKVLGYVDGDKVNVRAIAGKGFDVKQDKLYPFDGYLTVGSWEFTRLYPQSKGGGVKSIYRDGIGYLLGENLKGYGIYYIPNKGGRKDGEIVEVTSLFYECDNIGKDEQLERIKRLPLIPSMVIETRNSLHVYYLLERGDRQVDGWRKYQQRLIQLMESDRSIHNESRLMRLAGFFHQRKGLDPSLIEMLSENSNCFKLVDFDAILPKWDDTQWSDQSIPDVNWENEVKAFKAKKKVIVPNDEAFPLEICLTKNDRDLITFGVGKGEGYYKGFKLACNLIATQEFLSSSGYSFIGDAEDLFKDFAINSPESYHGQKDVDMVLNHARRSCPTPTLTPQMIENCINAWRRKNGNSEWIEVERQKPKLSVKEKIKQGSSKLLERLISRVVGGVDGIKKTIKKLKTGLVRSEANEVYKKGEGARAYERAVRAGYRWILDDSQTGAGKTHTVSQLNRGACFLVPDDDEVMTKLMYCPPSHRNPTNAVIEENWYETVARNLGYFLNYGKMTDLGSPYREVLVGEVDDHERTQSNCHLAAKFHQYYAAGRDTKGICGRCEFREKCAVKKGDGYGYISESKKWVTEPLIRTSTQWLDKEKLIVAMTGLILDESGQAQWVIERKIDLTKLFQVMDVIRKSDRDLHKKLVDIEYGLRDMIGDGVPSYGYDTKQILGKVIVDKDIENELPAIAAIEIENIGNPDDVNPLFLCDLIEILLGKNNGSLQLTDKHLTITTRNNRLIQACHAAKWVICQDATWSKEQMAMALGISEDEIYVMRQESEPVTNLVIEQYNGVGLLSNNRSEVCLNRVKMMRDIILKWHQDNVGFIDWKKYGQASDLVHCGDSRGSNAYKEKDVVVSFGLSRPNMTGIRLQYETMTGNIIESLQDESFSRFYNHVVAANLVQEIGRLRANRRPGQSLKFILIGDGDITFLEELGFNLVVCDAAEKFPEIDFGWKNARSRYINAAIRLCRHFDRDEWLEMTMGECAKHFERAISSLSKFIKRWFGVDGDGRGIAYERFKSLVYAAVYGNNGQNKPLSDDDSIVIESMGAMLMQVNYCGDGLGAELKNLIDVMGWELFLETVRRLKDDYGIKLLANIFKVALRTESD